MVIQMKNNMADDFDDGDKGKEEVAGSSQLENIINNIKSQMHSTNPAELERLSRDIDSFSTANIPEKILEILKTIQAIVNERKERAEQYMLYSQEEKIREAAAEEAKLQESIALLEKAANEKREEELKQHIAEYTSKAFQDKFDELLKDFINLQKVYDENRRSEESEMYNTNANLRGLTISSNKDSAWEFFLYLSIGVKEASFYLASSFWEGFGTTKDEFLAYLSMAIGGKLGDKKSIELAGNEPIPKEAKDLADKCVVQINKNAREVGSKKITYEQAIGYGKLVDKILSANAKPTFADNIQEGEIKGYADFVALVEPAESLYPSLLGVGEDVPLDVAALGQEDSSSSSCCGCVIS